MNRWEKLEIPEEISMDKIKIKDKSEKIKVVNAKQSKIKAFSDDKDSL